ncbi:hypothetical protein QBC47DRAFT_385939 [Echria macrotheca]|uniref:Uncharacterized protein n=1 Tax=Echria macrotheca TaxID=438768 RepID=A0AAJ0BE45_9PEZI|nr:hypothetical protein QBC47DRAFT_385939 [Echria macrotheca]
MHVSQNRSRTREKSSELVDWQLLTSVSATPLWSTAEHVCAGGTAQHQPQISQKPYHHLDHQEQPFTILFRPAHKMSSHRIPEALMKKVDEYVDSLAPQIQPRIASELDVFQQKTIDSLEDQVIDAFRNLFDKDGNKPAGTSRALNNSVPDAYGSQSLPFADEISKLTRSFSDLTGGAGDDLRDIFDLTEDRSGSVETHSRGLERSGSSGFKGFLSTAVNVVQDHLEKDGKGLGGQRFELDGLLGVISNTVKDAARNPEEKARLISPEIKEKVGAKLREQHAPIAEQFTHIALDRIKLWLRGNTTTKDLGDGVKGELEDQVKDLVKGLGGLFGSKMHSGQESARGLGDQDRAGGEGEGGHGFSKLISEKLSTGLAKVHRDVRVEFRKVLGGIEKELFELLPDQFQRPLEKILGGNPFDAQLEKSQADRGFGDDIKTKLVSKIRGLVLKVQETLREGILGVVNGGHRKFERESWVFVQTMVEQKVQKYLPKVKITVPDDIGNDGVSVGAPASTIQLGGGHQAIPQTTPQPPTQYLPGQQEHKPPQSQPQYQSYPPPPSQAHGQQDFRPDQYPPPPPLPQGGQDYRPDQFAPPPPPPAVQQYNPQQYTPQAYNPQYYKPSEHQASQGSNAQYFAPPPTQSYEDQQSSGQSQNRY